MILDIQVSSRLVAKLYRENLPFKSQHHFAEAKI